MERKTLLLSANYLPVKVIHWHDAIKLRYEGTAEVLIEYNEEIRSPSVTWKWPAVMRLKRVHQKRRNRTVRFSRSGVFIRDNFKCQYCGVKFKFSELTLDHVHPFSLGGKTEYKNIVAACKKCNGAKGDKTCAEWGKYPLKKPVIPAFLPDPSPSITADNFPPEWEGFVSAAE